MKPSSSQRNRFISNSKNTRKLLWRNNLILFFALMILIFIVPHMAHFGRLTTRIAIVSVVISGVFAAEYGKRTFRFLFSLGLLVSLNIFFSILFPLNIMLSISSFFLVALSLIFSTAALIFHMSTAEKVEKSTLLCAINSYLLLGVIASSLFIIIDLFVPNSFNSIDAVRGSFNSYIYFGFVTLSTLGYGDITPTAPLARSLSIFTAIAGQLYLVIVMALIIGNYLKSGNRNNKISD